MPITFLHYCIAYVINKMKEGLILPALIVSSVIPDLEGFFGFVTNERLLPSRGLMHSLIGVVSVDTFLAVVVTIWVYPVLVSWIFQLKKTEVTQKCRFSGMLLLSALVGSLFHVLIDSTSHEYNPLLYPFVNESIDTLVFLNDWYLAAVIVATVLSGISLAIFVYEIRKGTQGFWKRLLVE